MSQALSSQHSFVKGGGSVLWAVRDDGIHIDGIAPIGTPGPPATVTRVKGWFGAEIQAASLAYGVPSAILLALICNEAAGGQTDRATVCAARREEPGYTSDAATPERVSTGCCQTLLATAREALKRPDLTSAELADPATSIMACAAYVASQLAKTRYDPVLVAAAYNAGGLYPDHTPANRWRLRCFPLGTGVYIDRFVLWYNDAVGIV